MSERKIIEIKAAIEGIEKSVNRIAKGEDKVNWKQARVDAAVGVLPKMLDWLSASGTIPLDAIEDNRAVRNAVFFADSLIAELQRVPTHETKQE